MREEALKATYINLMLLASADGRVDPAERDYLKRFVELSGISGDQERRWQHEIRSGQNQFRAIEDKDEANEALALMARMVRVDGEFEEVEQEAYIAMGKALGFEPDELGPALREYWEKDPLDACEAEQRAGTPAPGAVSVLVVEEDLGEKEKVKKAAPGVDVRFGSMSALPAPADAPDVILFHAAEERLDSKARLSALNDRFPNSFIAFIARRDQAPQIGWLLYQGAKRCFVEPLFPNEIGRALSKMK
jgi:tellurite resistance protein